MSISWTRILLLAAGVLVLFAIAVAILFRVLPGPHSRTDYLVIGAVATLVSMLVVFIFLITTWVKTPDTFFKRKKSDQPPAGPS